MGQLGFQELILIFVVALLVFGPRKLPELGKSLGKGLREFRRATNDLKSTWEDQVRDAEKEFSDTAKDLRNVERDLNREIRQNPDRESRHNPDRETRSNPDRENTLPSEPTESQGLAADREPETQADSAEKAATDAPAETAEEPSERPTEKSS